MIIITVSHPKVFLFTSPFLKPISEVLKRRGEKKCSWMANSDNKKVLAICQTYWFQSYNGFTLAPFTTSEELTKQHSLLLEIIYISNSMNKFYKQSTLPLIKLVSQNSYLAALLAIIFSIRQSMQFGKVGQCSFLGQWTKPRC